MDVTTVDSSVLIAALERSHPAHPRCLAVLQRGEVAIGGHVLLETYSMLTGGRIRPRAHPDLVLQALSRLPTPPLTLSAEGYLSALRCCAQNGIVGGAIHDALVAATAHEADAHLVSRDQRAARTYDVVGVSYELIA
jgi:predicted nucleic acid-binding protein